RSTPTARSTLRQSSTAAANASGLARPVGASSASRPSCGCLPPNDLRDRLDLGPRRLVRLLALVPPAPLLVEQAVPRRNEPRVAQELPQQQMLDDPLAAGRVSIVVQRRHPNILSRRMTRHNSNVALCLWSDCLRSLTVV